MVDLVDRSIPSFHSVFSECETIFSKSTAIQDILILKSPAVGKILLLDGEIQLTEWDEHIYHEMFVHPTLHALPSVDSVLIIGGGDGGCLREVIKHNVQRVVLVEIDRELLDIVPDQLGFVEQGSFSDQRVELVSQDASKYVESDPGAFDVIFVDSTDADGPSEALFESRFYKKCAQILTERGILVCQAGMPNYTCQMTTRCYSGVSFMRSRGMYLVPVPSFIGGLHAFIWASNDQGLNRYNLEGLTEVFEAKQVPTKYYSPTAQFSAVFAKTPPKLPISQKIGS